MLPAATWAGTTFSYDPKGNLASDGLTNYVWNARDQLAGLSGGVLASFGYDSLARRRTNAVGGTATSFLYDRVKAVQELTDGPIAASLQRITGESVDSTIVAASIPDLHISLTGGFVIRLFCDQGNLQQAWNSYSLRFGDTFVVVGPRVG